MWMPCLAQRCNLKSPAIAAAPGFLPGTIHRGPLPDRAPLNPPPSSSSRRRSPGESSPRASIATKRFHTHHWKVTASLASASSSSQQSLLSHHLKLRPINATARLSRKKINPGSYAVELFLLCSLVLRRVG